MKKLATFDRPHFAWQAAWILILLPCLVRADDPSQAAPPALRLRFEWGGGRPEIWRGLLEISEGHLENPRSLGIEADEPGTLWADRGDVWIQRRSARLYDGFDVTVRAPADAVLTLNFQTAANRPQRERIDVRVSELYGKERVLSLGQSERRMVIRRLPWDVLSVEVDGPHVIYGPGETFRGSARLNLLDFREKTVNAGLRWELKPSRGGRAVAQGSGGFKCATNSSCPEAFPLEFSMPQEEGVYQLRIAASGRGFTDVETGIQLVVLSNTPFPTSSPPATATLVDAFEPASASVSRKVIARGGLHHPLQRFEGSMARLLRIGTPAEEPPVSKETGPVWAAYRLHLSHPGRPHQVVVSLPADFPQDVGISLIQPNAEGQLVPLGIDSGVSTSRSGADQSAKTAATARTAGSIEHRMLFWPHVRDPVLLVHAIHSHREPVVSNVQVYELGEHLSAAPRPAPLPGIETRWVGPYLNRPLLPEQFGALEQVDIEGQRCVDDWNTFYTASGRLVEYLQHHGHNALMLAVLADGSTIYPSELLAPTPRYDTGALGLAPHEPLKKDVVELLLRLFDREKLTLVPELQFSAPLPALERMLSEQGTAASGIQLVRHDGRTWPQVHGTARGLAPYYNPLDPRVQQAVLAVVQEFVDRYQRHPSFRGLAIELSSSGYLHLPGLEWGYDERTIARFEQATQLRVPRNTAENPAATSYEFLTTRAGREWTRWRCAEIARFHRQIARIMTGANPEARVLLSGHQLLSDDDGEDALQRIVRSGGSPEQLLYPKGLDFSLYSEEPRLTVLRPAIDGNTEQARQRGVRDMLNNSSALDAAYRAVSRGSLLFNEPVECRLAEFDGVSPWQPAYTWLVAHVSLTGAENRKRFARALAALDSQSIFEGGAMIPLGQEDQARDLRAAIASLPAVRFQPSGPQTQPVLVRVAHVDGRTYLYAVNETSIACRLDMQFSCAATTACQTLGNSPRVSLRDAGLNRSLLSVALRGYDVWCCVLNDPLAEVVQTQVVLSEPDLAGLDRRARELRDRMNLVSSTIKETESPLSNPGFEQASVQDRTLPGWELPVQSAAAWDLDAENPRSGKSALKLTSGTRPASLVSPELQLSGARFLTMSLWMRSSRPAAKVRLSLEANTGGKLHRQQALVAVEPQWRRYLFRVASLPEGKLEQPRVRVDALDAGELWIDDVEIGIQQLTPDDLRQLTKTMSAVTLAWNEQRYADCQRLLDSYWGELLFEENQPSQPVRSDDDSATPQATRPRRLFRR